MQISLSLDTIDKQVAMPMFSVLYLYFLSSTRQLNTKSLNVAL